MVVARLREVLRIFPAFVLAEDTGTTITPTAQERYQALLRLLLRCAKHQLGNPYLLGIFFDPNADAARSLQRAGSAEGFHEKTPVEIGCAVSGAMLLFTADGRLGLGSCTLEPGDLICVLAGLGMPFIVRPKGSSCTPTGCAHVDGVMDGELWSKNEDDLTSWDMV